VLRLPREHDARLCFDRLLCEAVADDAARGRVDVELRDHAEVDDLGDRPFEARAAFHC